MRASISVYSGSFVNPSTGNVITGSLSCAWSSEKDPFGAPVNYSDMHDIKSKAFGPKPCSHTKLQGVLISTPKQPTGYPRLVQDLGAAYPGYYPLSGSIWRGEFLYCKGYCGSGFWRIEFWYHQPGRVDYLSQSLEATIVSLDGPIMTGTVIVTWYDRFGPTSQQTWKYPERGYMSSLVFNTNGANIDLEIDDPSDLVDALVRHYSNFCVRPEGCSSKLWQDAVASPYFEGSNIVNLIQLGDTINDLKNFNLIEVINDIKKQDLIGNAANAWLTYTYSYKTTKGDLEDMQRIINNSKSIFRDTTIRSSLKSDYGVHRLTCNLRYKSKGLEGMMNKLAHAGLNAGMSTIWDMLPFSFVVDWLYPVGDSLSQLDNEWMNNDCYYDIDSIIMSDKYVIPIDTEVFKGTFTQYNRYILHEVPPYEFYAESAKNPVTWRHVVTSASLLSNFR